MNSKNLRRSVKYFAVLIVFYLAIVALLCAIGMSAVPFDEMGYALFHTWRGGLLFLMAVGMAVAYPIAGFVRREAAADFDEDRERIVQVFASAGFVLADRTDESLTFRAATPLRRLRLLGEDKMKVVRGAGGGVVIEGIRRVAVPAAFRIEAAARNRK